MKNVENYFKKNGFVYGVAYKYDFGEWKCYTCRKFTNLEKAYEWLYAEKGNFLTSELVSKTTAKKLVGNERMYVADTLLLNEVY